MGFFGTSPLHLRVRWRMFCLVSARFWLIGQPGGCPQERTPDKWRPRIRNMRISAELILGLLAQGVSEDASREDYPELEPEDIRACLAYAYPVIAHDSLAAVEVAGG